LKLAALVDDAWLFSLSENGKEKGLLRNAFVCCSGSIDMLLSVEWFTVLSVAITTFFFDSTPMLKFKIE